METIIREIPALTLPEPLEIEFYGYPSWEDQGIGAYEFWGQVGHHSQMVVVCESIYWNEKEYSDSENVIIQKYLHDNYEGLCTELEDQFEQNN